MHAILHAWLHAHKPLISDVAYFSFANHFFKKIKANNISKNNLLLQNEAANSSSISSYKCSPYVSKLNTISISNTTNFPECVPVKPRIFMRQNFKDD